MTGRKRGGAKSGIFFANAEEATPDEGGLPQTRKMKSKNICLLVAGTALLLTSCSQSAGAKNHAATISSPTHLSTPAAAASVASGVPRFDHVVVVVLENKAYSQLVGAGNTPFLTHLAATGAVLTHSYAITHPSQPNYLALFSGSTQGLTDDSCPHSYRGPNLAGALLAAGDTFTGYSQSLPSVGYTGCSSGAYARKHNPWVNFPALPSAVNQPMTAFPADLSRLPKLSFVIPNLNNDMHDGTISQSDQWLSAHLGLYQAWASSHNSLLIVTTDEDDHNHANQVLTIFSGAHVKVGHYATTTNHYGVLRTLLASFKLAPFGAAVSAAPITAVWQRP